MLEKLTLTNFQSHESTEITFGDRVTVIHGPTNNGKSSVMRALDWIANNGLDGDYFLSSWLKRGGRCAVTLTVDGHTITRERTKSDNLYTLDGVEYKAFGKGVPTPIAALLNLSPHTFQRQGDAPFLIGGTGSEAVDIFNTAAGLSDIDTVEAELRLRKNANDACIRSADEQIEEYGRKLRETGPWVALHALLQDADARHTAKEKADNAYSDIVASLGRLDGLNAPVTFCTNVFEDAYEAKVALLEPKAALQRAQDALQSLDSLKPCLDLSDTMLTQAEGLDASAKTAVADYANVTAVIHTLNRLPPTVSITKPQWPERPTATDYRDVSTAIASLDALQAPDTKRPIELAHELAKIAVCPECGASHEHWHLESVC